MVWVIFRVYFAPACLNPMHLGLTRGKFPAAPSLDAKPGAWEIVKIILIHRGLTIYRLCPRHRWED